MQKIIEKNEFTADVMLLEKDDKVKGGLTGDSNAQAIALANRTTFLKTELETLDDKVGALNSGDVGAEPAGTVASHVAESNPHTQYVLKATANLANGFVQLDATGKIPTSVFDPLVARYITVANPAERFALSKIPDLTIAAQISDSTLYYLNGNLDPSLAANWIKGQSATVSGVSSFNGRTDQIIPETGDYSTDMITETESRKFVTPAEKTLWGGKAEKVHTHLSTDVSDLDKTISAKLLASLQAGANMSITHDSTTDKFKFDASGGGGSGGSGNLNIVTRLASGAGQNHTIQIGNIVDYNLVALALKRELGQTGQVNVVSDFSVIGSAGFTATDALTFADTLSVYTGETKTLSPNGSYYTMPVQLDGVVSITPFATDNFIPKMTADNAPAGYLASSSGPLAAPTGFNPYYAFDRNFIPDSNGADCWAVSPLTGMSVATPIWLRIDMPAAQVLGNYAIQNRGNNVNPPRDWIIQGSNDDGATWDNLDTQTGQVFGVGEEKSYLTTNTAAYKSYRIAVSAVADGSLYWVGIANFKLYRRLSKFLFRKDASWYTVSGGAVVPVTQTVDAAYIEANGISLISGLTLAAGKMELVATKSYNVKYDYKPGSQIALPKALSNGRKWSAITAAAMTQTILNNGKVRFAITKDLINYYVFSVGNWVSIGTLTADVTGADKLIAQGMTNTTLAAITAAQWATFYPNDVVTDYGLAYGLQIINPTLDQARITSVTFTVNATAAWKTQSSTEVEIRWYPDGVVFKTISAGDYKFVYQFPSSS